MIIYSEYKYDNYTIYTDKTYVRIIIQIIFNKGIYASDFKFIFDRMYVLRNE